MNRARIVLSLLLLSCWACPETTLELMTDPPPPMPDATLASGERAMWKRRSDCSWLALFAKEAWQDHSRALLEKSSPPGEALLLAQAAIVALSELYRELYRGRDRRELLRREYRDLAHATKSLEHILRSSSDLPPTVVRTSKDFIDGCSFSQAAVEAELEQYDSYARPPRQAPYLTRVPD